MRPEWWAAVPVGMLGWWGLFQLSLAMDFPLWLESVLAGVFASMTTLLVRHVLVIEGAPWVRLAAREKPWPQGPTVLGIKLG